MKKSLLFIAFLTATVAEANSYLPTHVAVTKNSTNSDIYISYPPGTTLAPNKQVDLSYSFGGAAEQVYYSCQNTQQNRVHCGNKGYPPMFEIQANAQSICTVKETGHYRVEIKCIQLNN